MLGNTFVLPQAGGDITLVKVDDGSKYSSEYRFKDGTSEYVVKIRHTKTTPTNGRPSYDRHNVEVVQTIFAVGEVAEYTRKFYFVYEVLPQDTSIALADAVADKMIATSNALLLSLLQWES